MEREVKFSLVFRDMWQSAGKYVWKQMVVVLNR